MGAYGSDARPNVAASLSLALAARPGVLPACVCVCVRLSVCMFENKNNHINNNETKNSNNRHCTKWPKTLKTV